MAEDAMDQGQTKPVRKVGSISQAAAAVVALESSLIGASPAAAQNLVNNQINQQRIGEVSMTNNPAEGIINFDALDAIYVKTDPKITVKRYLPAADGIAYGPNMMCGPMAAEIWNLADFPNKPDITLNPKQFWAAGPKELRQLLPRDKFTKIDVVNGSKNPDFSVNDLRQGDVVYLSAKNPGGIGHIITVLENNEGKKYAYSNEEQKGGPFKVEKGPLEQSLALWEKEYGWGERFYAIFRPRDKKPKQY